MHHLDDHEEGVELVETAGAFVLPTRASSRAGADLPCCVSSRAGADLPCCACAERAGANLPCCACPDLFQRAGAFCSGHRASANF
jgi:hypothetical protein